MKKQLIFGLILAVLGIVAYWLFTQMNRDELFEVMKVPAFELRNENNLIITDKSMLGKVYLVEFFFTNCPTICPVMKQNILEIEKAVNHPDFGVISITIDPKRDTPQKLKLQKEQLNITNPNWHFLTGDRYSIYELSKEFNIYIDKNENAAEGLNHSGKFALVDKKGEIRSRYDSNGMPILYYSGINYKDKQGKEESLGGRYHPQIEWLKEDIIKLLNE